MKGISFKPVLRVVLVSAIVLALAGCSGSKAEKADKTELKVSAAASLQKVMEEIKGLYEQEHIGVSVKLNYASSGTLQQQIEQGAPVDVFVSAGKKQMDALWKKGLVDKPGNVAANNLVLVVPAGQQNSPASLQQLGAADLSKIAIGAPETVPAGKYAKEALEHAGVWSEIYPKLVMAKDVRQVLVYVETGNADAGLVYQTDALASAKVKIAYQIPAAYHAPIIYPAAVVRASQRQEAAGEFLKFLSGSKAQAVFKKHGFIVSK
jgi:molybdate transport system substrate-binding protein